MWRARRWRKLLNVIEQLPRTSAYAQAMATDDKLAHEMASLPDAGGKAKWRRSYRDYSPEVEMLSALFDRVGELIRVTAGTRGARSKSPQPAPRPIPAIERIKRRNAETRHRQTVSRVLVDK